MNQQKINISEQKSNMEKIKIIDIVNELKGKSNKIDENVNKFINECCKKTEQKKIRFGIKEIYSIYLNWCEKNEIKNILISNNFKDAFEKNGYEYDKSKGVDKNKKSGKRGYNILLEYDEKKINLSVKSNIEKESESEKIEVKKEKKNKSIYKKDL